MVELRKKVEGECTRKGEREKREAVRKETRAKARRILEKPNGKIIQEEKANNKPHFQKHKKPGLKVVFALIILRRMNHFYHITFTIHDCIANKFSPFWDPAKN
jgi:hypothetical protein